MLHATFTCETCRRQKPLADLVEVRIRAGRARRCCAGCERATRQYVAARYPARKVAA